MNTKIIKEDQNLIRKNFSALLSGEALIRILMFFFTIKIARDYGPQNFGIFTLALTVGGFSDMIIGLGVCPLFTRNLSQNLSKTNKLINQFFPLRIILSICGLAFALLLMLLLNKDAQTNQAIIFAASYFMIWSSSGIFRSTLTAYQKMGTIAFLKFFSHLIIVLLGLILIHFNKSISYILLAYIVAAIINFSLYFLIINKKYAHFKFKIDTSKWKNIIKESWPIAAIITFSYIYTYLDTLMISYIKGEEHVALYQAGYKIIGTALVFSSTITNAYLPQISAIVKKSHTHIHSLFQKQLRSLSFWAIPIVTGGVFLSKELILFIYGNEYLAGEKAFTILIISIYITFISSAYSGLIFAANMQRKMIKIFFIGAIGNFILNLFFIPKYGISGAAMTTVATELFVLFGLFKLSLKITKNNFLTSNIISLIAAIIMILGIKHINDLHLTLIVTGGAMTYFISYYSLFKSKIFIKKILNYNK